MFDYEKESSNLSAYIFESSFIYSNQKATWKYHVCVAVCEYVLL